MIQVPSHLVPELKLKKTTLSSDFYMHRVNFQLIPKNLQNSSPQPVTCDSGCLPLSPSLLFPIVCLGDYPMDVYLRFISSLQRLHYWKRKNGLCLCLSRPHHPNKYFHNITRSKMLICLYVSFFFSALIWQLLMGSEMRVVKSTDFSSNIDLGKNPARSLVTWPSVN